MARWSELLAEEVGGWPQVRSRPMFGMLAFYRGKNIFACVPRTKGWPTKYSVIFKDRAGKLLPAANQNERVSTTQMGKSGWLTFEMASERDVAEVLRWFERAYRAAR